MTTTVYSSLDQQYDPILTASVGQVVSSGLASVSGLITTVLTLFVIVLGVLLVMHELHWKVAVNRALRATAVGALLTAVYYNQFVQQPFLTGIPNWMAQAVNNAPAVSSVAGQFDLLLDAVTHEGAAIKELASSDVIVGAIKSFEVDLIVGAIGAILDVIFTIYEFTRFIVGLVVCLGPFVIMGLLFDYTRTFADRWVSKLIGAMLLQLMYVVLVQIMIRADTAFMVHIENAATSGIDEQLANLVNIIVFFLMGAGVAVLIPGVAAYIGGGVPLSPSALTRLPGNIAAAISRAMRATPPKPAG
jgi:type IV secretion system protein VirB6